MVTKNKNNNLSNAAKQIEDFLFKGKKPLGAKIFIPDAINTKRIRKKLNMSQSQFAKHYKFNLRTLQEWEQGRKVPSPNQQLFLKIIDKESAVVEKILLESDDVVMTSK